MSLLASIGAVDAVFRGAAGLVRELKRPKASSQQEFSAVLQQELQGAQGSSDASSQIEKASSRFLALRDADGNGTLNAAESGFDAQTFARYDVDGNGELSQQEIQAQYAAAMKAVSAQKLAKG